MPIRTRYGKDKLSLMYPVIMDDIYLGETRISKIYLGESKLYDGDIKQIASVDAEIRNIGEDNDNVYIVNDNGAFAINKITKEITQITTNTVGVNDICCNDTYVLFFTSSYHIWHKPTNKSPATYTTSGASLGAARSAAMDETYSYILCAEGIIRRNNSTKDYDKLNTHTAISLSSENATILNDGNLLYIHTKNGMCYTFNKSNSTYSVLTNAPSGVDFNYYNIRCQNSRYIFHVFKNSSDKYNHILVTDKVNKTTSFITTLPDTLTPDKLRLACNENYLFVTFGTKIYKFNLSKNLTDYTIEDWYGYSDPSTYSDISFGATAANDDALYVATTKPTGVFEYKL